MGSQIDWETLVARAWSAREKAYAPYSKFSVGAALATETGEIFSGCNVENASFGLTICAERIALSGAVLGGSRNFAAIAVAADTEEAVVPCGACRQFMAEFNPALKIRCIGHGGISRTFVLSELLPLPFSGF